MRIGVDAMGGDKAPAEPMTGILAARELLGPDDKIVVFGRKDAVMPCLEDTPDWSEFIEVVDCSQAIDMDEPPVEAIRDKPESSIAVMARAHRDGDIDAMISAGNTGAYVAAAQMYLRRLRGVHRPGIGIVVPTFHGPAVMCDVGANVNCRPLHLMQYGVMSSIYLEKVANVAKPRVGLLSIGEEANKGNALVKKTRELLSEHEAVNFIGNVEGRDLFRDVCDVMVCEGFVGNVCLKLMEGLAEGLFKSLAAELPKDDPAFSMKVGGWLKPMLAKYDFNEYGGAPLLGVKGICIICHGASNFRAYFNAIRVAIESSTQGVNELITAQLTKQD